MGRSVPSRSLAEKPRRQPVPIDIERLLVWTYRDQKAHRIIGLGRGLLPEEALLDGIVHQGVSGDGCVQLERQAVLGCKVDGGGNFIGSAADLHPDAEATHRAVLDQFDVPMQILLIEHAITARQPEWTDRLPRLVKVLNGRGQPRIRYEGWDVRRNYGACEVQFVPSLAWVEFVNRLYLLWHDALTRLAQHLQQTKTLRDHAATLPDAPQAPWLRY